MARRKKNTMTIEKMMEETIEMLSKNKKKEMTDKEVEKLLNKHRNLRDELKKLQEQERNRALKQIMENSIILAEYDAALINRLKEKTGLDFWVIDGIEHYFNGEKSEDFKGKVLLYPKVNAKVNFKVSIKEIVKSARTARWVHKKQKTLDRFA